MNIYVCSVCSHLEFLSVPEKCPVCSAPHENFKQNNDIFKISRERSPEAELKHVPLVMKSESCGLLPEDNCTDVHARIGEKLHPMEKEHFIQFIDFYVNKIFVERVQFTPNGVNPAGSLHLQNETGTVTVVENCNLHGYWQLEVDL